jgi:hypothetical protein
VGSYSKKPKDLCYVIATVPHYYHLDRKGQEHHAKRIQKQRELGY